MARKLDSTITVTLSFPALLSMLASIRGGGLARINGDLPYPPDGAKQIILPKIDIGIPLPEGCEVVSASSNGDYVNVTLWHESFAGNHRQIPLTAIRLLCIDVQRQRAIPARIT
jgi:hypothetical protein